jgi:hypothetical protein
LWKEKKNMKSADFSLIFLNVLLFVTLVGSAFSSVYNTFFLQALPISAEIPKVILQQGTAGLSTIYTNDTSAKVSVSSPVGFEYGRAFKSSEVRVETTSGTPVDDPEAVLNISLQQDSYIFIVYNAGNKRGSIEDSYGKGCAINIDGMDVAFSWQSPYGSDRANSVTVIYATNLTAGSHIIKGRFFANDPGWTVGIDIRQIVAFWFPDVVAEYVRSTVQATTKSTSPVDDAEAVVSFTLAEDSVAFIVYNAGNQRGSNEDAAKGVTLNIDGADISTRQWQSPYAADHANSVTIVYATTLTNGSHTVKGRFFSMANGKTVTIDERQLIVFCFPISLVTYWFKESATSASTSSGTPVDDAEASLNGTLSKDSDFLVLYTAGNPSATEYLEGKGTLLNVDGVDKSSSTSWQSPYGSNYPNSVTSIWYEQVAAGSHTVGGRFFSNLAGNTVTISHRQIVVLAFSGQQQTTIYDYVLKVANQVVDAWKIRLRAYNQSNIGRLSNCTVYFYDGSGISRQIYILNGAYNQTYGNWYDLTNLGIVYIAMAVSATITGTSYVYTYLEVLIPGISTYNLMIITFEST